MAEYVNGNIFASDCKAIVNAVNCRSVMGAGLAMAFREHFPEMYKDYQATCHRGELEIGKLHTWKNPVGSPRWIVNFPTMIFPGEKTKRETLVSGFVALDAFVKEKNIPSVGLPALGCGIGRFPWEEFKELAEEFASNLPDVRVVVYEPH